MRVPSRHRAASGRTLDTSWSRNALDFMNTAKCPPPSIGTNRDPLLDAADLDVPRLVDAVWSGDGVIARIPRAQGCPCRFEHLAVGAGRRSLPGGRDANKKQESPQRDGCS